MKFLLPIIAFGLSLVSSSSIAGGVYQEPGNFIKESFNNNPPAPQVLWINKKLKKTIENILQHNYNGLRIRYWRDGNRTVWILDEIGKEKPITTGIIINHQKIERVQVLIFRESRGWEVRHKFFTEQFDKASLKKNMELDRHIDSITGATLSVRAVTKLVRLALFLDQHVTEQFNKS